VDPWHAGGRLRHRTAPQRGCAGCGWGFGKYRKSRARLAAQRKAVSKIKTVDINSANLQQLKKLPGIGDAEAQRIIAGRPYASKIWLVTNGVIGEGPYAQIKHLIVAKQAFKTAEENAAFYEKLQKEKAAKAKP